MSLSPCRSKTPVIERRQEEYLIFCPETTGCVRTNFVGALVYGLCDGRKIPSEIADVLSNLFSSPRNILLKEVTSFLTMLENCRLISFDGPPRCQFAAVNHPVAIYLNLTNRCNLSCDFCCSDAGTRAEMEMKTANVYNVVRQIGDLGCGEVILSGGEPLLRTDLIQIAEACYDIGLRIHLITNGLLMTRGIARQLARIHCSVQISIEGTDSAVDGCIRGNGAFEKTKNAVELLKEEGINVAISPVVLRTNINDIPRMLDFASEIGASSLQLNRLVPAGRAHMNASRLAVEPEDFLRVLLILSHQLSERQEKCSRVAVCDSWEALSIHEQSKRVPHPRSNCGFGAALLSIAPNGDVFPCHMLHVPDFKAGNATTQKLGDIYSDSSVLSLCREITVDTISQCKVCRYRHLCGGGCRADAYYNGNVRSQDSMCKVYRGFFDQVLWT